VQRARDDHAAAIESLTRALEHEPNRFESLRDRADSLLRMRQVQPALADLTAALKIRPDHVELRVSRGGLYGMLKQHEAALADLNKVLELAPDHALAQEYRASILHEVGRLEEAEQAYLALLKLRPGDPMSLGRLGYLREARKNWAGALEAYEQFLANAPDHRFAAAVREAIPRCKAELNESGK